MSEQPLPESTVRLLAVTAEQLTLLEKATERREFGPEYAVTCGQVGATGPLVLVARGESAAKIRAFLISEDIAWPDNIPAKALPRGSSL